MEKSKQSAMKLRQEAESQLERKVPSLVKPLPGENLLHELMHELRVSKIELEMQNESLRQSQIELEKSRDRYVDLYEFALVGYLTLNQNSLIQDINLPGAELLGVERNKLLGRRFASFVAPEDQDHWNHLFHSAIKSDQKFCCKLKLRHESETPTNIMLICQRLHKLDEQIVLRITLIDITETAI